MMQIIILFCFFIYLISDIINLIYKLINFQVHTKRRNRLHQQKMNDLVFVMHNLRLRDRNTRKNDCSTASFTVEDLSSDDEWIVEEEDMCNLSNKDLLNILSSAGENENDENVEEIGTGAFEDFEGPGSNSQDDLEIQDIDAEDEAHIGTFENMDTTGSNNNDIDIDGCDEDDDGDGRASGSFDDDRAADDLF